MLETTKPPVIQQSPISHSINKNLQIYGEWSWKDTTSEKKKDEVRDLPTHNGTPPLLPTSMSKFPQRMEENHPVFPPVSNPFIRRTRIPPSTPAPQTRLGLTWSNTIHRLSRNANHQLPSTATIHYGELKWWVFGLVVWTWGARPLFFLNRFNSINITNDTWISP